jgi:hypothetical protein
MLIPFIIAGAAVAGAATSIVSAVQSSDQTKKATENAANQQAAANAALVTAQDTASSQAQAALSQKRQAAGASQDVYTSPLGLTTQANTARKTLLGN